MPRIFLTIVGAVAVITMAGMALLWPGDGDAELAQGLTAPSEQATVIAAASGPCPPPQEGSCAEARIQVESGADEGSESEIALGDTRFAPELEAGDAIRVTAGTEGAASYTFSDFERRSPMLWLALAFALLVIVFGRLRGALSLVGLVASLAVVVTFIVPAILDGSSPLVVAVVGSLAVMLLTILLAHGFGPKSLAAILGTTGSLLLVALLASVFTGLTNLTGFSSEETTLLVASGVGISFDGLLLAGMVIGALGVLDDVTVSQASTVLALRRANPDLDRSGLYRRALDVGRDHVSATVNTLVLAYVGASLPLLLIFSSGDLGFTDAVNVELVAKEVVAMLVGSIGLIAAVPITTALASVLARSVPAEAIPSPGSDHGH